MVIAVKGHGRNSVGGGEAKGPNASPVIRYGAKTENPDFFLISVFLQPVQVQSDI
jgi:hypothetical protein